MYQKYTATNFYIFKQINNTYPQGTLQAFDSCQICHRIQTYPAYAWWPGIVKLRDKKCCFQYQIVHNGYKYIWKKKSVMYSQHPHTEEDYKNLTNNNVRYYGLHKGLESKVCIVRAVMFPMQ